MKTTENANPALEKAVKMTLRDYYESLPAPSHPKKDFMCEVCARCHVNMNTVINWIRHNMKPKDPRHIEILSEVTGIAPEDLWKK